MEVKQKLSDITVGLTQFLKSRKYKEACINKYINTWEYLEKYMIKSGITSYSREVGEAYIKDRIGDIPYYNFKQSEKKKVRYIQALSDYQERGIIYLRRLRVPEIAFQGKLGISFNGFIEYLKGIRRTELTIKQYKERLNTMYLDLQQSDQDISCISAPYMVQYLSRLDKTHTDATRNTIIMTIRVFLRYLCTENLLQNNNEGYWQGKRILNIQDIFKILFIPSSLKPLTFQTCFF